MSEADAKKEVAGVFDETAAVAAINNKVSIIGLGKFAVKDRLESGGRNPASDKPMTIAVSKKVSFTAAQGLKD